MTSQQITIDYPARLQSLAKVDPASNAVSITNQSTAIGIALGPFPWAPEIAVEPYQGTISADLANAVLEAMNLMASVPVPGIETFSLDSLQFPGQASLQLDDAALPGDLVLFGRVTPPVAALQVTPAQATVVAGGTLAFSINATGATWSVQASDGGTPLGHVDNGVYLAPTADQMGTASRQEIVTATLDDGRSTSAVVILSARPLLLNPSFIYTQADQTPLSFRATSISGENVQWSGEHVQAGAADPFLARYAPPASTGMTAFYELGQITATTDSGVAVTASVLVVRTGVFPAFVVGGGPWDPASPDENVVTGGLAPLAAGSTLQLKAIINGQDLAADVVWSIAGDNGSMGRIDSNGLYTAPAAATTDCVVAMAVHNDEDFGYVVIPLVPTAV